MPLVSFLSRVSRLERTGGTLNTTEGFHAYGYINLIGLSTHTGAGVLPPARNNLIGSNKGAGVLPPARRNPAGISAGRKGIGNTIVFSSIGKIKVFSSIGTNLSRIPPRMKKEVPLGTAVH